MAAGSVSRILRAPGRIVLAPTNLAAAYPYGGTEVGKANQCALTTLGTSFRVESEALGEATDVLEGNNHYLFTCFLRGWDDDAIRLLLADGYELGAVTQHAIWHVPGNKSPGQSSAGRAVKLLYVPDDIIHAPAVLIYNGIPELGEGAEIALSRAEEFGLALGIDCLRDSSSNVLRIGRLADLTL